MTPYHMYRGSKSLDTLLLYLCLCLHIFKNTKPIIIIFTHLIGRHLLYSKRLVSALSPKWYQSTSGSKLAKISAKFPTFSLSEIFSKKSNETLWQKSHRWKIEEICYRMIPI